MDRITSDLLANGSIMQSQVDRLLAKGISSDLVLRDITLSGFITMDRLVRYIVEHIRSGVYELSIINNYDYIEESDVLKKLAKELNLLFLDLDSIDMDYKLASKVPLIQLKKHNVLPISEDDMSITIAFNDPLNINTQESIQRLFPRKPIKIAVATKKQILSYLYKIEIKNSVEDLVRNIRDELNSINSIEEQQEASSILLLIDVILDACIKGRASDVHVEPTERNCVVRARVDGKLTEMFIFDKDIYPPLASRLKLLANLDIAEKRKPQDGRFSTSVSETEYDFRISTLPILYGESIVMRVLDKQKALVKLEDAGMDSVSYHNRMNLIQQVQVNPKVGLSFADSLRSILRQDPDKIMIGEIRDQETLEIAIKAALTGHLVGIENYLISGALVAIQAQRLVRKICPKCKIQKQPPSSILDDIKDFIPKNAKFYIGKGCKECNDTGYMGREMIRCFKRCYI